MNRFEDTPWSTLAGAARDHATGVVRCTRGKLVRVFCLREGALVYGRSNVREEQILEGLVRGGWLSAAQAQEIEREAAQKSVRTAEVLRARALVPEADLEAVVRDHLVGLLRETLASPDGRATLDRGTPKLDGELTSEVEIGPELLASRWLLAQAPAHLRRLLGPPDVRLRRAGGTPENRAFPASDPSGDLIAHVLRCAAHGAGPDGIARGAPGGEERALACTLTLLALGVLETDGATAERHDADDDAPTRQEVEGWLARARSGTLYDVLGLDATASPDGIRSAYYRLARRLHPDRLRTGPLADVVGAVEQFFTRVTDAYNTLSDAERRTRYDRELEARAPATLSRPGDKFSVARQNFLRGRALAERKKFTEAVSFLENAVQLDNAQPEFLRALGKVLTANPRRREDAERFLRRATGLDPSNPEGWVALGDLLLKVERHDEAARAFQEALRWDDTHAEARARLGELTGRRSVLGR